jgi:hypothetical protein
LHVTEIALNLFHLLPGVATSKALPVISRGLQHCGSGFPIHGRRRGDLAEKRSFGGDNAGAGFEQTQQEEQECGIDAEVRERQVEGAANGTNGVHDEMKRRDYVRGV